MSQDIGASEEDERKTLPIEKGFPIERVNEIAKKETTGGAREYYRPIYTMHKWWARRAGSVFRSISLYSLLNIDSEVEVHDPGVNADLGTFGGGLNDIESLIEDLDIDRPETLWPLYSKDVRVEGKKVLDPFMGGGTTLGEASRFGAEVTGYDLNPVAWFVTKKEMEAHDTDLDSLDSGFEKVKSDVKEEIKEYYRTSCPNDHQHDADVMYYLWVKELDCSSCGEEVPLFKDYRVGKGRYENKGHYNVYCPDCSSVTVVEDWRSESECSECGYEFIPQDGNVTRGGNYTCTSCGQKYGITDAIQEQGGFDIQLYGIEYYCSTCDGADLPRNKVKGYKTVDEADISLYQEAVEEWEQRDDLQSYIPSQEIPEGAITAASSISGNDVFQHSITKWEDMFNERQLLCLSKLLKSIDNIENREVREYLLLAFTETLNRNSMMGGYNSAHNGAQPIFKTNSFDPPQEPAENNVWGTKHGAGPFWRMYEKVKNAVEYAKAPTERYIEDGETIETKPFAKPIGEDTTVLQGDIRSITAENEYDAVITDPPYYDNIVYSEVSDYYYVWMKILLEDEYEEFSSEHTPKLEIIVANPYHDKGTEEFESELQEAFETIREAIKEDGVLAFTYHHSSSESWGELLESLSDSGFIVTATYPITADLQKLGKSESVSFDIIIVARPAHDRQPISWNSLRRNIYRTAQETRQRLEETRDLSRGDIGVIEMGRCFHEYSKHHGKVKRAGEPMGAKEVVDEIYGVIQHGSDIGEVDVFLDLLETANASYDDLNKLTRGTDATPERMEEMQLYRMDNGLKLGTWKDEKRIAYIQSRIDSDEKLTDLDKAQYLRYRYEQGKSIDEFLSKWETTDGLQELCEGLADATGDETYRQILESQLSDY